MRILFLTNNDVSQPLALWLSERATVEIVGDPIDVEEFAEHRPDLVVSYSYRHLLRRPVLDLLPGRFLNLHISYLPYNRGADPNFWSIIDGTPKGVTIHLIDEGLDTGPIVAQRSVLFDEECHTLSSSYLLMHDAMQDLFRRRWPWICELQGPVTSTPQRGIGTDHKARQFSELRSLLLGEESWEVPLLLLRQRYLALSQVV